MKKNTENSNPTCRPPKGTTYLTIGQDLFSINEYITAQYNASLHAGSLAPLSSFTPSALMVYTDLRTLRGLDKPIDYGSGVEYANGLVDDLFGKQDIGLQIGLWLDGAEGCDKINSGLMDDKIQKLIEYLNNCNAVQIFLRIGYEFDNQYFGYSSNPSSYAKAFRRIVNAIRSSINMNRIQFVWHSWAAPRSPKKMTLDDFYPGDKYVDWIGISIFQQVYPWSSGKAGTMKDVDEVMQFASAKGKPTMIAESTPFGGIDMATTETKLYNEEDPWNRWYEKVLNIINKYDVSMWCYINCDWDSQPMWHGVGFGETRISSNDKVMRKWQNRVVYSQKHHHTTYGGSKQQANKQHPKRNHRPFLLAGSLKDCTSSGYDSRDKIKMEIHSPVSLLVAEGETLDTTFPEQLHHSAEPSLYQSSNTSLAAMFTGAAIAGIVFFVRTFLRRPSVKTKCSVHSIDINVANFHSFSSVDRSYSNFDSEHHETPNEVNPLLPLGH